MEVQTQEAVRQLLEGEVLAFQHNNLPWRRSQGERSINWSGEDGCLQSVLAHLPQDEIPHIDGAVLEVWSGPALITRGEFKRAFGFLACRFEENLGPGTYSLKFQPH